MPVRLNSLNKQTTKKILNFKVGKLFALEFCYSSDDKLIIK